MPEILNPMDKMEQQTGKAAENLRRVRHKVAVMSGKGGVGKTTVAVNLAALLAAKGYKVGLLDADIDCPNVGKMLGTKENFEMTEPKRLKPVEKYEIKIASMSFFGQPEGVPIIFRGPMIHSAIMQLLEMTEWGLLDFLIIDMPPGCLTENTMVFANPKPIKISEIKAGDYVYSFEGGLEKIRKLKFNADLIPKKVAEIIPQGKARVFEIKTRTKTIKGTANHPILAIDRRKAPDTRFYENLLCWKKFKELKERDIILSVKSMPQEKCKPFKLPISELNSHVDITTPPFTNDDFMKIIGYFIGDGYMRRSKKGHYWGVWFAEPQTGKYRKKYVSLLKKTFGVRSIHQRKGEFAIISNRVAELFDKLELCKKANNKTIPSWIFALPLSQKKSFIEGYCDADGHRRKKKAGYRSEGWLSFDSPNKNLIEGIRLLCIFSGMRTTNLNSRVRKTRTPSGFDYTRRFWSFEGNYNSINNRYEVGLIRGKDIGTGLENEYVGFERVKSVKYVGEEDTYDLRLEDGSNFIADGFVVHNTSDATLTVMQFVPLDGVIIVTTPQELSLMDAVKSANVAKQFGKRFGIVENMAGDVFGKGAEKTAKKLGAPFLGSIPLAKEIRESCDSHMPIALSNEKIGKEFEKIADNLKTKVLG